MHKVNIMFKNESRLDGIECDNIFDEKKNGVVVLVLYSKEKKRSLFFIVPNILYYEIEWDVASDLPDKETE